MVYPNYKNKHLEEALILPDHNGDGKRDFYGKISKKCIITYQSDAFNYLLKRFNDAQKCDSKNLWGCSAYFTKDFIFVKMNGVGSPHATLVFEELISLGIEEFLNIGISGGLNKPGFFVCEKSIRDEGTSQHYLSHSKYTYPDNELTNSLEKSFKKLKIDYIKGVNWTIDAPFMETKKEIKYYREEGVNTVEMEASALFVVAKFRKVKIAAAFFTSDILGEEWDNMNEHDKTFVDNGLARLAEVAVDCFS